MDATNEFSFILKPSPYGIGVFATHDIQPGTHLRLFGDNEEKQSWTFRKQSDVPAMFQKYCLDREGESVITPPDFGQMSVGWYLNHSDTPNAHRDDIYRWFAYRLILEGEEITIDYNSLELPSEVKF